MKHNVALIKQVNAKKVVFSCAGCYRAFKEDYTKELGDLGVELLHVSELLDDLQGKGNIKINRNEEVVTYHDPCHLGRHSGIYDEPREILESLGYEIVEMKNNREDASCCGGGGGLKSNYPELSNAITKDVLGEAKKTKTHVLVTACPMCDACFLQAAKDSEMNVKELSELLVNHLS